jgi:hypothetical protein
LDFLITSLTTSVKYLDEPGPTPTRNNFLSSILFSATRVLIMMSIFYLLSFYGDLFLVRKQALETFKTF